MVLFHFYVKLILSLEALTEEMEGVVAMWFSQVRFAQLCAVSFERLLFVLATFIIKWASILMGLVLLVVLLVVTNVY